MGNLLRVKFPTKEPFMIRTWVRKHPFTLFSLKSVSVTSVQIRGDGVNAREFGEPRFVTITVEELPPIRRSERIDLMKRSKF